MQLQRSDYAMDTHYETAEFWEGYEARNTGKRLIDNPYGPGSQDYTDWNDGWEEADEDNADGITTRHKTQ
jgi:ribosome modulation factor